MKILLFDKNQAELAPISALIKETGHQLVTAADSASLKTAFASQAPQLVLLVARGADNPLLEKLPELQKLGEPHGTMVAMICRDPQEEYLTRAYDAGVDSEIRLPFGRSLLTARLRAMERMVSRFGSVDAGAGAAPAADAPALAPLELLAQSAAWGAAADLIKNAASTFLTLPVTTADAAAPKEPVAHACRIMLLNASDQIEFRIAVGADSHSARGLCMHLFGEDGEDLAGDMLSELGNILMGAVKTALSAESIPFTGGLPEAIEADHILRPTVTFKHQNALDLLMGDARVVVHLGIRSKANLFVTAAGLHEGMILAKDVFNARGLMVLNGGTRLSRNMIEQLEKFLPPKATVEVMAP